MSRAGRWWFRASQRLGIGPTEGLAYWERRARLLGSDAVVNSVLRDDAEITSVQMETVLPEFRRQLRGDEALIVDFGCGTGRFTPALAELARCPVLGVDPIAALVESASASANVSYAQIVDNRIPVDDGAAGGFFICEVLGAITDDRKLAETVDEIDRALADDGFVVLAESESGSAGASHWRDRSFGDYANRFSFLDLERVDRYEDDGHEIVVMSGRRPRA